MFRRFFHSEKAGGFVLIACTLLSLLLANQFIGEGYVHFWHQPAPLSVGPIQLPFTIEGWINEGLMTFFFLLAGLEIERELYIGELSTPRHAVLPMIAAVGGMVVPAGIHLAFNAGTPTQNGFGIPMATDIAFALGVLSLAGNRIPTSLKIFLTALAIIDDLGAIVVIAIFYTGHFSLLAFTIALVVFAALFFAGKRGVEKPWVYWVGGIILWYAILQSGIHPSISGVLLAFAIPFGKKGQNVSRKLQQALHFPVAFGILPLFALANTAIVIPNNVMERLATPNSLGIMLGLVAGKTIGIFGACYLAVKLKLAHPSAGLTPQNIAALALLGGIGFTMSIFITTLAFDDAATVVSSKVSILLASVLAAVGGLTVLKLAHPSPRWGRPVKKRRQP